MKHYSKLGYLNDSNAAAHSVNALVWFAFTCIVNTLFSY